MSFIGSLFSDDKGAGFQAQGAEIQDPLLGTQLAQQQRQAAQDQQASFINALAAQNGIGNQSSVFNQLQGVANGTGPNPAQAALANSTGANVANQAALMAGQRGSGANAGLIARQAGMQGGAIQQNAAGQAAALQANQSLGALNQLGGIAGQQVGQLGQAQQQQTENALNTSGQQINAIQGLNNSNVASQNGVNSANAGIANTNAQGQWNILNKVAGAAGTAAMPAGGKPPVPAGAAGGMLSPSGFDSPIAEPYDGPKSHIGRHLKGITPQYAQGGMSGQKIQALVSPGEKYLDPKAVAQVEAGKSPMKAGETIPGKPAVGGSKNSYANDTVHKALEAGGIVLPRSVTQSKDPDQAAIKFIAAVMAKNKHKGLK